MAVESERHAPRVGATLERRIAACALATAVAVLLTACIVFAMQLRDMDGKSLRAEAREFSAVLARRSADFIADPAREGGLFDALREAPSIREAILFDAHGHAVTAYTWPGGQGLAVATTIEARSPVVAGGRAVGEVMVRVASHRFDPLFISSIAICAALFFGATAIALFIGRWLAARVLSPVHRLSAAMAAVTESGDFDQIVPDGGGADELERLTASFNALLLRLRANDRALRRTLADLMETRDAAEAANVQKSEFLANMSHEIRTPLNGVLAMTQVIARGELAEDQRRRLEVVHQSGEALLAVLNDVLDVSKIEAGKMVLEPLETDVGEAIRDAVDAFQVLAEAKGLELSLVIAPSAEGRRMVDVVRFRQVLGNLLSNAVKFTERGSVHVRVDGAGAGGEAGLRICVIDTGIGIDPDRLPHIFDKFIQGDNSTTRRFGGTGLGLSISRNLVEMMGGAVWADRRGEGAAFHVVLPLPRIAAAPRLLPAPAQAHAQAQAQASAQLPIEDAAASPAAADRLAGRAGRPLRILAAEDNAANRLVLSTIMQVFGLQLEIVEDGRQAVEACEDGGFDLILMDIQMPVMDGIEATRTIREREAKLGRPRTPIIALSANAMTHQVRAYLAAGMDDHVAKPIELNRLQAALERALSPDERPSAAVA